MDEKGTKKTEKNGGSDMKKYCMIVKTESYSGITLLVDDDFEEDWDSPILKGVLKDFPKESRSPQLFCPLFCSRGIVFD